MVDKEEWRPGSFTKNFSWGPSSDGLKRLHEMIRIGFDGVLQDVPRAQFRVRVRSTGRPDYIALNFFLFNKIVGERDYIVADELVFQALTAEHSPRFDKLALFAFNFSYAGEWHSAEAYQRRPALWAYQYVTDRVAKDFRWDTSRITADDIEAFVQSDPRYTGATARKLATNLNYLYSIGGLRDFKSDRVERWWVDALFLALDRLIETSGSGELRESEYANLLTRSKFLTVAGRVSLEKSLAATHLIDLYTACGGRGRFSDEFVKERTKLTLPDVAWLLVNDNRPRGAVHPSNPAILKSIPRACAFLARYAGFEVIDADELESFDAAEFVRRHTRQALEYLQRNKVEPLMSADELEKLTRDK